MSSGLADATIDGAYRLTPLHRLWRHLPSRPRRWLISQAAALLAPHIDRSPPAPRLGVAVAGELSRASGLGEGARLMLRALEALGIPCWPIDVGQLLPAATNDPPVTATTMPPAGVPMVLHINPPLLPMALLRLPRDLVRDRRIIGYWSWELQVAPPEWRIGAQFVHEVWVPSPFTAASLEPMMAGRVRVVPHPVAINPPIPSAIAPWMPPG